MSGTYCVGELLVNESSDDSNVNKNTDPIVETSESYDDLVNIGRFLQEGYGC